MARVISFRLAAGVDPEIAVARLRTVLRPNGVTVVASGREGRMTFMEAELERALLVLCCVCVRGGDD